MADEQRIIKIVKARLHTMKLSLCHCHYVIAEGKAWQSEEESPLVYYQILPGCEDTNYYNMHISLETNPKVFI